MPVRTVSFTTRNPPHTDNQAAAGERTTAAERGSGQTDENVSRHRQLIAHVAAWLHDRKTKRAGRRGRRKPSAARAIDGSQAAHDSDASDTSDGLDQLEQLLAQHEGLGPPEGTPAAASASGPARGRRPSTQLRPRASQRRLLRRGSSSDGDHGDSDPLVPSCDAVLDNTQTFAYSDDPDQPAPAADSDASRAWSAFKHEIVRLAHTLKLKGWRRVPLDGGDEITVQRLSGALTNAVYMVSPPSTLLPPAVEPAASQTAAKPPPELLLRIYGPQVAHLIDRGYELQILQRLARQKIGPRLLGTFTNGRFEEYLHARTLTARDIRRPEMSRLIAKRMRELHDGVELLRDEVAVGPAVWRNWDKWLERATEVVSWTDRQARSRSSRTRRGPRSGGGEAGLVCGVEWPVFRQAVDRYRAWLTAQVGGLANITRQMVFAHNDTQYGNILRLEPSGQSPLLLPANEHRQLVVIDFEYAAPNTPGQEFANHFTEWCYDYHAPRTPYALTESQYPTPDEQRRFLRAYLEHVSRSGSGSGTATRPSLLSSAVASSSTHSISGFMLDSRRPPAQQAEEDGQRARALDQQVERLLRETRLWRAANSAQWVAWGVVQACLPEAEAEADGDADGDADADAEAAVALDKRPEGHLAAALAAASAAVAPAGHAETEPELERETATAGFDYLAYAHDRALFFWGDVIALGVVARHELPPGLVARAKYVDY
ncbi:MAG: hypothetical protein M1826_005921 [Phylliscum demangeonii]|nr:MAG: hypothetical protein M1826_005921 [Phylliscum demangeonii]